MPFFNKVWHVRGVRLGATHDLVHEAGEPYLERWILWFGCTLRLHHFHKGDDDRAFHDHPWWFVTLPLNPYLERLVNGKRRLVKPFRPHYRPAKHRHIVELIDDQKVWTFIVTGPKQQEWGFWHEEDFVPHELWLEQSGLVADGGDQPVHEQTRGAA